MTESRALESGNRPARDPAIDVTRGLIMVLMALDHVRIFIASAQFDPTDVERTSIAYFLTRWITHLCAPGFFFIAGLSAGLLEQKAGRADVARLLLIRGAWLIALEILVFGLAWSFNPGWWWFGVIAGLGAAMMAMSALIYLPRIWLFGGALAFTLTHNLVWNSLSINSSDLFAMLYSGGLVTLPITGPRVVLYPLLPWLALMAIGYASTPWLTRRGQSADGRLLIAALTAILAFVLMRGLGVGQSTGAGYDPSGTRAQDLMSFLNVEKYPPSLQFSLVTLGLCLLFLAMVRKFDWTGSPLLRPLLVFGQVPFFFYLLHLFMIHAAALALAAMLGWPTDYLFWHDVGPNLVPPDGYGFGLAGVYLVWLAIVAALLAPCARFARFKRTQNGRWLKLL